MKTKEVLVKNEFKLLSFNSNLTGFSCKWIIVQISATSNSSKMLTIENPGHFEDQDVVQAPGIVILEDLDHVLDQLHVHVFQAAAGTVEHDGQLIAVVLAMRKKYSM